MTAEMFLRLKWEKKNKQCTETCWKQMCRWSLSVIIVKKGLDSEEAKKFEGIILDTTVVEGVQF